MIGHKIKLYNLPQRVEGGIKVHGLKLNDDKEVTVLFHHLDGAYSYCPIEGDEEKVVHLSASTPLVELEGGEYKIDEGGEDA